MDLFTNPMSLKMLVPEETVQSLSDRGQDMKVSFLDAGVHGGQRASGLVNDPSIASLPSCPAGLARLAGASRVVQETDGSHETFMQGLAHRDEHQEHEEGGRGATGKDSEGGVEDASTGREHKKNCHFCQHVKVKKGRSMVACETPGCTLRFCVHCLNTQFTQEVEEVWRMNVNGKWSCPLCKQICCCTKIPRLCDELHRHCKAYRYRDKRAQEQSRRCKDSSSSSSQLPTKNLNHSSSSSSSSQLPTKNLNHSSSSSVLREVRAEEFSSDSILHLCNPLEEPSWEDGWGCSPGHLARSSLEEFEPLRKRSVKEKSVSQDD